MSLKLSEMKDESIKTLENITEIIISKNFQQQNPPRLIEDKAKLKEMELVAKKKDFLYQ
jgi:predicted nucleotidyltransferase